MILWINLVTNGLPALALGVDPPDPTQMREPPRKRTGSLLGARDWLGIAFVGVCMGGAAIVCYLLPLHPGDPRRREGGARHGLLAAGPQPAAARVQLPLGHLVVPPLRPVLPIALVGAILMSAAIHLVAVLVPSLRPVFQTFALSLDEWVILLALSASILPASRCSSSCSGCSSPTRRSRGSWGRRRAGRWLGENHGTTATASARGRLAIVPSCVAFCSCRARACWPAVEGATPRSRRARTTPKDPGFAEYAATHGIQTLEGGGAATEVTADGLRLRGVPEGPPREARRRARRVARAREGDGRHRQHPGRA